MDGAMQHAKAVRLMYSPAVAPPRTVEYAYYAVVINGIMGGILGLSIPLLGAAGLAALAAFCIWRLGLQAWRAYAPLALPLACGVSFVAVQIVIYGESLMDQQYVRTFVPWMISLIIVYSLYFRRGFLHRFVLVVLVIGLASLPFLSFQSEGYEVERAGLERTAGVSDLPNPNFLAAWFGFCCVYFAILGLETKRHRVRIASWLVAVGCLFIVGLTVSRGALLAVAIATVVAFRRLLKRGFLPVLLLIILIWLIYEAGLFVQITAFYTERGLEETGRLPAWTVAIERFLSSPLAGIGLSEMETVYYYYRVPMPPHNSFLFFAVASGVIPLAFYVAYWMRAVWGVLRAYAQRSADASFLIPLLIYAFLISLVSDFFFMSPWSVVTLSAAIAAGAAYPVRGVIIRQLGKNKTQERWASAGKAGPVIKGYRV